MDWRELRTSGEWGNMGRFTHEDVMATAQVVGAVLRSKDAWALTYQPGNASRYDMWLVPIHGHAEPWMLVALENFQTCYRFNLASYLHPTYVAEKLNLQHPDGAVIAEFLMALGEVITGVDHAVN